MNGRLATLTAVAVLGLTFAPAAWASDAETLSVTCYGCHGTDGASPGAIPAFNGKAADALKKMLIEYKTGAREATVMDRIMKGYSDAQIDTIVNFIAKK